MGHRRVHYHRTWRWILLFAKIGARLCRQHPHRPRAWDRHLVCLGKEIALKVASHSFRQQVREWKSQNRSSRRFLAEKRITTINNKNSLLGAIRGLKSAVQQNPQDFVYKKRAKLFSLYYAPRFSREFLGLKMTSGRTGYNKIRKILCTRNAPGISLY